MIVKLMRKDGFALIDNVVRVTWKMNGEERNKQYLCVESKEDNLRKEINLADFPRIYILNDEGNTIESF